MPRNPADLPEHQHDFVGRWCLFTGACDEKGKPVVDPKTGFLVPGDKEYNAEVVQQRFLGLKTTHTVRGFEVMAPDWMLQVRGASGKTLNIYHRANRFRLCID